MRIAGAIPGGAPSTVVRSLVEQSYRPEIRRHVRATHRELPGRVAKYPLEDDLPPWFRREKALDPVYTYDLLNVVVSPSSGLVWLEDESIALQESVGSLQRMMGWDNSLWETNVRPSWGPDAAVVLPWNGYFHFLLETLPAFMRSMQYAGSEATVIVPQKRPQIVNQALSAIGVNSERICEADRPLRLRRLVFSGLTPYSGFVDRSDVDLIRSYIADYSLSGYNGSDKIYVSRQKSPRRSLGNEEHLERELSSIGFDIIYAEELSLKEQITAFSGASYIVAPHGAGLANLVWRRNACQVVEVFPHNFHNDCYARLAVSLGFQYRPVTCRASPSTAGEIHIPSVVEATSL